MATVVTTARKDPRVGRPGPGSSWSDREVQVIPSNRLAIVFACLICSVFLASLDGTIIATALPTMVEKLGGGNSYSWVGSAYMLSGSAVGPLYGKLSNIFGRKPIFFSSLLIFLFGSAMCGAAQNMTWLIVSRAIQGIGGGGILQLTVIITSDIVPLKDRGRYAGLGGLAYGTASVTGPVLGGALAQHVSWRWCFLVNLPIGGITLAILFAFLNLPHEMSPIRAQLVEFDFIGLICFVAGAVCVLLGFEFSQSTWTNAKTIAPIVVGFVLLVMGAINEMYTKRSAILPPRLFKTRTTGIILIITFLDSVVFAAITYYLPSFYQVIGASATVAGTKMITFSLGISFSSVLSGAVMSKTGGYRGIIWVAYVALTLGTGLMITLNYTSNLTQQLMFPLVAACGLGVVLQAPMVALQAAIPQKDAATAMSAYMFVRTAGSAVGMSVGEAIITTVLPPKLGSIPNFKSLGLGATAAELNDSISKVHLIHDLSLRNAVLHAWSAAIATIWIASASISGFMLVLTFLLREYSLDRKVVRDDDAKTPGALEKGDEVSGDPPKGEADPHKSISFEVPKELQDMSSVEKR